MNASPPGVKHFALFLGIRARRVQQVPRSLLQGLHASAIGLAVRIGFQGFEEHRRAQQSAHFLQISGALVRVLLRRLVDRLQMMAVAFLLERRGVVVGGQAITD